MNADDVEAAAETEARTRRLAGGRAVNTDPEAAAEAEAGARLLAGARP